MAPLDIVNVLLVSTYYSIHNIIHIIYMYLGNTNLSIGEICVFCMYPGWTGITCSQPCPEGKFGVDCSFSCHCQHGDCHHINGTCICHIGYTGRVCSDYCPVSYRQYISDEL